MMNAKSIEGPDSHAAACVEVFSVSVFAFDLEVVSQFPWLWAVRPVAGPNNCQSVSIYQGPSRRICDAVQAPVAKAFLPLLRKL